jgi:endo-1,4-beta-xylanase
MKALTSIYLLQVVLIGVIFLSLLFLLIFNRKLGKKRLLTWGLFGVVILLIVLVFKLKARPLEIEKNYLDQAVIHTTTLADAASKRDFYVGAAVANDSLFHHVAKDHFNSVTPENALKWGWLVPKNRVTEYDFSSADSIVNYAIEHGLRVRGHVLVWGRAIDFFHSPDLSEILEDLNEDEIRDTLEYLVYNNIETVLNHFRGRISNWDCVNEPLEVFNGKLDNNILYRYLGKEYIANSFRWAYEIDPSVTLFLNEQFNTYDSKKALAFLDLCRELIEDKVPIHGVAIQAHAMFTVPELEAFREFLEELRKLDLKIEIAEMDARLRLFAQEEDPYQAQGDFFREFTRICLENPAVEGITVWGIIDYPGFYDGLGVFSWHRPNNPLLFDTQLNPKPSYFGMLDALMEQ